MFTSCAYIMENYSENFFMHSTNCNFNKRVICMKKCKRKNRDNVRRHHGRGRRKSFPHYVMLNKA